MAKKNHEVKNSEHIAMLAFQAGYKSWYSLWHQNTAIQGKRENPLILFHGDENPAVKRQVDGQEVIGAAGDTIVLPEVAEKQESGATDAHHPFEANTGNVFLRLRVLDENLKPIDKTKATYQLVVDGVRRPLGQGGEDSQFEVGGMINVGVPGTAQNGRLLVRYAPPDTVEAAKDWPKDIPGPAGGAIPADALEMVYQSSGACPHYAQVGRTWSSRFLGAANTATIAEEGCAVCCVAMVLKYYGRDVTPETLDNHLDKNKGYLGNRLLWDEAYKCKETKELPKLTRKPSVIDETQFNGLLDSRIKKDLPTIAHVDTTNSGKGNHFVVIVGKGKDGYIMNDPGAGNGDGASSPTAQNTVEQTKRKSGYKIKKLVPFDVTMPPEPAKEKADPVSSKRRDKPLPLTPPEAKEKAEAEAEAKKVNVTFWLQIGRLDPIKDKSGAPDDKFTPGVQQRLNNLAFDAGPVDGVAGDETKDAIKRFQRRFKLDPVDGEANDDTLTKLKKFHDGPAPPAAPVLT